jgi:CheY-like chemotaxis protein
MKLLIVEDNERMRRTIKNIVEDLADELYECDDGADALAMYGLHRPDWVFMDIRMGEVDGIAATRQILSSFPRAKIVIVTEYDDTELQADARQAGARGYVVKRRLFELRQILVDN